MADLQGSTKIPSVIWTTVSWSIAATVAHWAFRRGSVRKAQQAVEEYDGNPWVRIVHTPSGGIKFDMMMYFPNQNYPELGYGDSFRRIGDWAYVHE